MQSSGLLCKCQQIPPSPSAATPHHSPAQGEQRSPQPTLGTACWRHPCMVLLGYPGQFLLQSLLCPITGWGSFAFFKSVLPAARLDQPFASWDPVYRKHSKTKMHLNMCRAFSSAPHSLNTIYPALDVKSDHLVPGNVKWRAGQDEQRGCQGHQGTGHECPLIWVMCRCPQTTTRAAEECQN